MNKGIMGSSLTFDQTWIENRFRKRPNISGSKLALDQETGFRVTSESWGFTAERKKTFLGRFRLCQSIAQIAESVEISVVTVYDHIALDPKFREEFIKANQIEGKAKQLSKGLMNVGREEKKAFINDMLQKAEKYNI